VQQGDGKLLASYVSKEEKLRYSRSVVRWQGNELQQGLFFVSIKSRNLEIFARGWWNVDPEPGQGTLVLKSEILTPGKMAKKGN